MKGSHKVSVLQGAEKKCYITGKTTELHKHHIFYGTALRKISDKYGFWIWLTPELHNMSKNGVHFNRELDLAIKRDCQREYEKEHTRAEFMELVGRNYLD